MTARSPGLLLLLAAPIAWRGGAPPSVPDPVVTSVSPAVVSPGQNITLTGTNLARAGYIAELQYTKKYIAAGESPTGRVDATSTSATQLVFVAPSNAQPQPLALRYRVATLAKTRDFSTSFTALSDTSFASRAPFAVPGRVDVIEQPVVLSGSQGAVIAQAASGQLTSLQLLLPGAMQIRGRNLVPPPSAQASVSFNGASVPQTAAPRYDATANGGRGGDVLSVQVAEPASSAVGSVRVTTPGGTATNASFMLLRRPRVIGVDEISATGSVIAPAAGHLIRGHRYQLRGTDFAFPAAPPYALASRVQLGSTFVDSSKTVDATHVQFIVPATFAASSAQLLVSEVSGFTGSGGTFSVSDPGTKPPPLADVVIAPSPAPWGTPLTATVAFAGSIAPGIDVGAIVVTSPTTGDFIGLPLTVPITSNPQVVTIPTRVRSTLAGRTIRVRLARLTGATDSLDRRVQLTAPTLTGVSLSPSTVAGGAIAKMDLAFDFPAGASTSCGSTLFAALGANVEVSVTASDTSVEVTDARGLPTNTICASGNPTHVSLVTHPVTSPHTVTMTAQLNQTVRTATLTILPPSLASVKADRPTLTSMQSATGTISMSAPASNAIALLTSSDPSVSVPAKFPIPNGSATATFAITTLPVSSPKTVTISAAVNGVTQSTTLTLMPLQITSVSLSPSTVRAGTNAAATITLNATIDLPFTANVTSSDPSVATVPATVSFAAHQSAAVFSVQAVAGQTVQKTAAIAVRYSVTLPGGAVVTTSGNGSVTVTP